LIQELPEVPEVVDVGVEVDRTNTEGVHLFWYAFVAFDGYGG
jgi:hypothetical protein